MNLELNNNVVVITGGTGGIGSEIVAEFLNEDAKVICLIRSEAKMALIKEVLLNLSWLHWYNNQVLPFSTYRLLYIPQKF